MTHYLQETFAMSQRRACRLAEQPRATQRYESRRAQVPEPRERLVELAHQRPRFGYPRLYVLLRRDGFAVNKKRVYRLYREAGLKLRAKRRRRGAPRERFPMTPARGANQSWSIDFVADRLGDGRAFRTLTVVDDLVKRCLALEVDTSLSGERVTRALDRAIDVYGKPGRLVMDNGPEFTSRVFIGWALRRGIEPAWIEPGKPVQNAYAESFNARFRDECLNQHLFTTLADARELIEAWREDYNHVRPHTSLDGPSPEQFVERSSQAMACELRSSPDLQSTASPRSQTSPDPT